MEETYGGFRKEMARVFYPINDKPFGIDLAQREEQEEHKNCKLIRPENQRI